MSPTWAPNIHPLVIHFPISLLLAAVLCDILSAIRPDTSSIRNSATWLYCVGGGMTMAAYFTGLSAAGGILVSPAATPHVATHFLWADRTTWFFIFFASFRLAVSFIWQTTSRWVAITSFLLAVFGLGLLVVTFEHGGRLVFQHGLGVSSVPSTGRPWTASDQPSIP